ncbi:ATP synthase F1 subunit gamma [Clostridium sp. 'White wine YQ']|uniref:ATP synthase F1 subunit gamma n=1 Tax=Clostridium sp. 'White wine YQ' TaxID=3027474 RepID=UPI0023660BA8|nr:ATP synthase F1 subunit gamma [Clostridium sp. 'White wine YQ']MDD7792701.1 ATP synthase F1 subunit gamma [Clostridium sp. 'White wine YQ']
MAGAGLLDIKRRIKSVNNTRKITKAMGLVATSKLRKTRQQLSLNDSYLESVNKLTESLVGSVEDINNNIYFNPKSEGAILYILMTSDSGLCGGYNGNTVSFFASEASRVPDAKVMVVGQKGLGYLKKYSYETVAEYVEIPDVPTVKEAKIVYEHAIKLYREGKISGIRMIYTDFISPVKQELKNIKLLPLEKSSKGNLTLLAEPSIDEVLEGTLEVYLKSLILNCMLNSKASEQSLRMSAMDGATKNADDLLDALNTKYNRIRQGAITQEISEIVGGAEAQK